MPHTMQGTVYDAKKRPLRLGYADTTAGAYTHTTGEEVILVDSSGSGTIAITLPAAIEFAGKHLSVYSFGAAGSVTVATAAGTLASATTTITAAANTYVVYYSDGTNWILIKSVLS